MVGLFCKRRRKKVNVKEKKQEKARQRAQQLVSDARSFLEDVKRSRVLPVVDSGLMLQPGEVAFYSAHSVLHETRSVRQYQAGHLGVEIVKGIYIGGTEGESTSTQEWREADQGDLTITNKRLIFGGRSNGQTRTVPLSKILSVRSTINDIEISVDGLRENMLFTSANPAILRLIIGICTLTEDPCDLSQAHLDYFDFAVADGTSK